MVPNLAYEKERYKVSQTLSFMKEFFVMKDLKYSQYTVESVTSGHPDKICDQVSDGILDACLSIDSQSRVAIECMGTHGKFYISGEVTTKAEFNASKIAKSIYKQIGYTDKLKVLTNIVNQSRDIACGVDVGGAGDQGIMYGYATDETESYLPLGVYLVHKLTKGLEDIRKAGGVKWLKPDGKAQVTVEGRYVTKVLVSCQHSDGVNHDEIENYLKKFLIDPTIGIHGKNYEILVNPTGRFVNGGFFADTGLTGRKIMVDSYGGMIPHGGGAFSGKDPTKVDRSGAYMARYAAKNMVYRGLGKRCLVSVSYAIGKEEPLMVYAINEKDEDLSDYVMKHFDFRPMSIIDKLNLRQPIYRDTASYGHFGRDNFPWEKLED
jgi:S-adenosylmethionine synthetase